MQSAGLDDFKRITSSAKVFWARKGNRTLRRMERSAKNTYCGLRNFAREETLKREKITALTSNAGHLGVIVHAQWYPITFMARKYHSIHANSAFCIFAVFYTQSAVGKPHLLRSLRFVSEFVFYIQFVTRFISHDQSVLYIQWLVRCPQSAVYSRTVYLLYWPPEGEQASRS